MNREQLQDGLKVVTKRDLCGVPSGSPGTIKKAGNDLVFGVSGNSVMVTLVSGGGLFYEFRQVAGHQFFGI